MSGGMRCPRSHIHWGAGNDFSRVVIEGISTIDLWWSEGWMRYREGNAQPLGRVRWALPAALDPGNETMRHTFGAVANCNYTMKYLRDVPW